MQSPKRRAITPNLRCVCEDRDLAEVLASAQRHGWTTAAQAADGTGCGSHCGSCRPYISRMLRTGKVPSINDLMDADERARWE